MAAKDSLVARDLGEVLEFMRLIWALDHALQKKSKRMASALGVTGPQRLVLRIVGRLPGIDAGQLAAILHLHPSTLTGMLDRLERANLVRRQIDSRDGRRSLFRLMSRGAHLDSTTEGTVEHAVQQTLGRVSSRELQSVRSVLKTLTNALLAGQLRSKCTRRPHPLRKVARPGRKAVEC